MNKRTLASIFARLDSAKVSSYLLTGRIRDLDNSLVQGFIVQAYDKDPVIALHPDDPLGKAYSDENGNFEISFASSAFKSLFVEFPKIYITVRDRSGKPAITTDPKQNTTGRVDFEIKLNIQSADVGAPDIYSQNYERLAAGFGGLRNSVDLSAPGAQAMFELVMGAINSWLSYRDEVVQKAGYDGIQVPEIPKRVKHNHITRWDEAVLPK